MNDFEILRQTTDSDEEAYFIWYLEELKAHGYIESYERAETYELSKSVKRPYTEQLKTKLKHTEQHVMHGASYTPDFVIYWTPEAIGLFVTIFQHHQKKDTYFYCDNYLTSIIEIKGMFDRNNMIRLVTTNIKWMYEKHNIYVHLVKMPKLFKDTFCPKRYLFTNKSKMHRKINFKIKSIEEYVAEHYMI